MSKSLAMKEISPFGRKLGSASLSAVSLSTEPGGRLNNPKQWIFALQRSIGNRAVTRSIRNRLVVVRAGEQLQKEANRLASINRATGIGISRQAVSGGKDEGAFHPLIKEIAEVMNRLRSVGVLSEAGRQEAERHLKELLAQAGRFVGPLLPADARIIEEAREMMGDYGEKAEQQLVPAKQSRALAGSESTQSTSPKPAAKEPEASSSPIDIFVAWRDRWSDRYNELVEQESKLQEEIARKDPAVYANNWDLFQQGKTDALGPEYEKIALELAYHQGLASCEGDVLGWIEGQAAYIHAGKRKSLTFEEIDQHAQKCVEDIPWKTFVINAVLTALGGIDGAMGGRAGTGGTRRGGTGGGWWGGGSSSPREGSSKPPVSEPVGGSVKAGTTGAAAAETPSVKVVVKELKRIPGPGNIPPDIGVMEVKLNAPGSYSARIVLGNRNTPETPTHIQLANSDQGLGPITPGANRYRLNLSNKGSVVERVEPLSRSVQTPEHLKAIQQGLRQKRLISENGTIIDLAPNDQAANDLKAHVF